MERSHLEISKYQVWPTIPERSRRIIFSLPLKGKRQMEIVSWIRPELAAQALIFVNRISGHAARPRQGIAPS